MKNTIGILGLILPALIILLGVSRVFITKPRGVNGVTIFFAFLLLLIGFFQYFIFKDQKSTMNTAKAVPIGVSKHSDAFNLSIENVLNAYIRMTDGFVNSDPAAINQAANELNLALDTFKIDDLKVDTLIYETALQPYANLKAEIVSIISDPSLEEKRGSLNIFSNELYSLLRTARYDLAKVYWKECPFAFGPDKPGNWLSKTEETMNPYGKEDCAEVRSTIDFMLADSTAR